MTSPKAASTLLRICFIFVYAYASIDSFLSPKDWLWFIPNWIQNIVPGTTLLPMHATFELTMAVLLLLNRWTFYVAIISGLNLLFITCLNLGILDTVFRDIGLSLASFALAALATPKSKA